MVTVVPPSGTLLRTPTVVGMVVEDENVKVESPNVWAEKSQLPVVSSLVDPVPVMCAVPVPDNRSPVSEAKSWCRTLKSNE